MTANSFSRTIRALEVDHSKRSLAGILLAIAVLAAWMVWFFMGSIPLYVASTNGQVEVESQLTSVDAVVPGRILMNRIALEAKVREGDILVELDSRSEQLEMEQQQARIESLRSQIESLRGQIQEEDAATREHGLASGKEIQEARFRFEEASAALAQAKDESERLAKLHAQGLVAESELVRAQSALKQASSAAEEARIQVERVQHQQSGGQSERRAQVESVRTQLASLEGEAASSESNAKRLQLEIEKKRIRAPVTGTIAAVGDFPVGAVLEEKDRLATILPPGAYRFVGYFPSEYTGRIRTGQPARFRLQGFPWTEFGTLDGAVSGVAAESRDQLLRIEFRVLTESNTKIPLQHGLPGSAEIKLDRVSPARVVIRAIGQGR